MTTPSAVIPDASPVTSLRVGLVGATTTKLNCPAPAGKLCISDLFVGRRQAVERSCDRWYVLSARHGLVHPDTVLEPYGERLSAMAWAARRRWSDAVVNALVAELGDLEGVIFEVHAGAVHADSGLADALRARGAVVENPVARLRVHEQLSLYARIRAAEVEASTRPSN